MAIKKKSDKPNYQEKLAKKASELHDTISEAENVEDQIDLIFAALSSVALESWKNGIEAGKRQSQRRKTKTE